MSMNVLKTPNYTIQLLDEIGHGSFGSVHKGTIIEEGVTGHHFCAVKVIKCFLVNEVQTALREITILTNLSKHDNITRIFTATSAAIDEGFCTIIYIVMEYCNGGSLSKRLHRASSDVDHVLWMYQMANGLNYLHEQGIAHRDLKPDNVLMMIGFKGEQLKLGDFGLSKAFVKQTSHGQHVNSPLKSQVGSPPWAAPEVLQCVGEYGAKADIFSLGAICYGILEGCYIEKDGCKHHGAFVYVTENVGKMALGVVLHKYPDMKIGFNFGFNPMSDALKCITSKMLELQPKDRPDASQVEKAVKSVANELTNAKGKGFLNQEHIQKIQQLFA